EYRKRPHFPLSDYEQRIAFMRQALDVPRALQLDHAAVDGRFGVPFQHGLADFTGARRTADGVEEEQDQATGVLQLADRVSDFTNAGHLHRHRELHQRYPLKEPQYSMQEPATAAPASSIDSAAIPAKSSFLTSASRDASRRRWPGPRFRGSC